MGVPRHQYVFKLFALIDEYIKELLSEFGYFFKLSTGKKLQIKQNLIVTGASAMYFLTYIAQTPSQHQFNLRMNIFNSFFNHKIALFYLSMYLSQLSQ
ncbi:hypothetical protein SDC9_162158 [bioreactor metagenome]|uniref:Uncharacterized protein n=1 Tax=bioreactor metagenome TaxID=1076179 RepID=A0A645FNB1_9ZZZZ